MNVFKFEMKKLWRQKKFLWLLIIALLCTLGVFQYNAAYQSQMPERALGKIQPYFGELSSLEQKLKNEDHLDERHSKQLEILKEMETPFLYWSNAINRKQWDKIPMYEGDFLSLLKELEKNGGEFKALQGTALEKEIQKNDWLRSHHLAYEDEKYPISPHLILKETTTVLFSVLGIFILLLFFGSTITAEKEQLTWLTLKTQPVPKRKLIAAKCGSMLTMMMVFLVLVIGIGWLVPLVFGDYSMAFQYPQIITTGDHFSVISTRHYLTRAVVLFVCDSLFTYSLVLFLSNWLRQSFSVLLLTSAIIALGYFITDLSVGLQSPFNPFQYFRISHIVTEGPWEVLIYLLATLVWSCLLVMLTVLLPERESGLFQVAGHKKPFRGGKTYKHMRPLWKFSIFEWRKIKRNGFIRQVYFILFLIIALSYVFVSYQTHQKEDAYVKKLKATANGIKTVFIPIYDQSLTETISKESGNEFMASEIDRYKKTLAFYKELLAKNKAALKGYAEKNLIPVLEYQLFIDRLYNNDYEDQLIGENAENYGTWRDSHGQFTLDVSIAEKHWLMERHIQPLFPGEFVPTIFTHWGEDKVTEKNKWEDENTKIDNSGLFSLYLFFDKYLYFVPMILFLFLLGGGFASEKGKKSTLHFLKTQPISVKNIFLGKLFNATAVATLSSVGMFVVVVLVGTCFDRLGDWQYPILHYDNTSRVLSPNYTGTPSSGYGFHFLSLGDALVQMSVLFLLSLLFLLVLTIVLSLFIKSPLSVFAAATVIEISGYFLSRQLLTANADLSPFTYFKISKIINGEVATLVDNSRINFQTGSLVLLASTLILTIIGYLFLSWKNNGGKG